MAVHTDCTANLYALAAKLNFSYTTNQLCTDELIHTAQLNFCTDFFGLLCKNPYRFFVRFDLQKSAVVAKINSVRCTVDSNFYTACY
jgi:hypothetical protein